MVRLTESNAMSVDLRGHLLAELQEIPGGRAEDDGGRGGQNAAGDGHPTDRHSTYALGWVHPCSWQGMFEKP